MNEGELRHFNDSLERCRRDLAFIDHFYNLLMTSSEEVAAKFNATDFRRQKRVLMASMPSQSPALFEQGLDVPLCCSSRARDGSAPRKEATWQRGR